MQYTVRHLKPNMDKTEFINFGTQKQLDKACLYEITVCDDTILASPYAEPCSFGSRTENETPCFCCFILSALTFVIVYFSESPMKPWIGF